MKMRYFATSVDSNIYGSDGKSNFTRDLKTDGAKFGRRRELCRLFIIFENLKAVPDIGVALHKFNIILN